MLDYKFVELVEKIGYVNEREEHVYGTAALLHFIHRPVSSISQKEIQCEKTFVQKYLSA